MVKNYMEDLVDKIISEIIKSEGEDYFACTCEKCMDSIKAVALNGLPPFYITTKEGEIFGEYSVKEIQNRVDIIAAVSKARNIVANNPKH